jgi:hypothetical protein
MRSRVDAIENSKSLSDLLAMRASRRKDALL